MPDVDTEQDIQSALDQLVDDPVDLNSADRKMLSASGLFTNSQVNALLKYRKTSGPLVHIAELQVVPGFDPAFIVSIADFVQVKPIVVSELRPTWQGALHQQGGVAVHSAHRPMTWNRQRIVLSNGKWDASLSQLPSAAAPSGRWSISLATDRNKWMAGSMRVRAGTGLGLWQGHHFSVQHRGFQFKSAPLINCYKGWSAYNTIHGLAWASRLDKWESAAFVAVKPTGNDDPPDQTAGAILQRPMKQGQIGAQINGWKSGIVQAPKDALYTIFMDTSQTGWNGSIFGSWQKGNLSAQGELARGSKGWAGTINTGIFLTSSLSVQAEIVKQSKGYSALLAGSELVASYGQPRTVISAGMHYERPKRIQWHLYSTSTHHHWSSWRHIGPKTTKQFRALGEYQWRNKTTFRSQIRWRIQPYDQPTSEPVKTNEMHRTVHCYLQCSHPTGQLQHYTVRMDAKSYRTSAEMNTGWVLSLGHKIRLNELVQHQAMLVHANTSNYQTAVWLFTPGLPYSWNNVPWYGQTVGLVSKWQFKPNGHWKVNVVLDLRRKTEPVDFIASQVIWDTSLRGHIRYQW